MRGFRAGRYEYTVDGVCYVIVETTYGWRMLREFLNDASREREHLASDGKWKNIFDDNSFTSFDLAEEACDWFWVNVMGEPQEETTERRVVL